jgi:hypothetical protein
MTPDRVTRRRGWLAGRKLGRELLLPVHLDPVTVRIEALERHHLRVVVMLDDLDPVRAHPPVRGADILARGEPEPEVQERLRLAGIVGGVQREVEAIPVADDDRAVGVTLRGSRVEPEVCRVEKLAAVHITDRQAEVQKMHSRHARDAGVAVSI